MKAFFLLTVTACMTSVADIISMLLTHFTMLLAVLLAIRTQVALITFFIFIAGLETVRTVMC